MSSAKHGKAKKLVAHTVRAWSMSAPTILRLLTLCFLFTCLLAFFLTTCSSGLTVHSLPYQGILLPSIAHDPMANAFKGTAYPFRIAKESSITPLKTAILFSSARPDHRLDPFFFFFFQVVSLAYCLNIAFTIVYSWQVHFFHSLRFPWCLIGHFMLDASSINRHEKRGIVRE